MSCRLCKKPIVCDFCLDSGEIEASLESGKPFRVECPQCHGLHPKCYHILNSMMEAWHNAAQITRS